jgi:hypothetical protein
MYSHYSSGNNHVITKNNKTQTTLFYYIIYLFSLFNDIIYKIYELFTSIRHTDIQNWDQDEDKLSTNTKCTYPHQRPVTHIENKRNHR